MPKDGSPFRIKAAGAASRPSFREEKTLNRFTADTASALPGPDWLRARRVAAAQRFEELGLPSPSEEVWRYSRIGELDLDEFAPVDGPVAAGDIPDALRPLVDAVGERAGLLVSVNGRVVHVDAPTTRGVTLGPLADDDVLERVATPRDAFGYLNSGFVADTAFVRVAAGVAVREPIVVIHWIDAEAGAVFPRTFVEAGEASEVTVVELVASADVRALVVPVVELDAHPAANLRYLNVQRLGTRVWQLGYQGSRVDRDATLQSSIVALGGDYARVRADSKLVGIGATSNLLAVYFGDANQMHDFRTMQDHDAPKTTSDLLFKGAVEDTAESVYTGLIRVKKGAAGTKAYQTNRNLVLSEGAAANSVPNLEIEENDVTCSHASAVGPIDEEQRYYLEARGIPTDVAERLIVLGFFDDVLERVPVPGLRAPLREAVAAKLR
ncbi:MAG TPA: Fe-S cluster assembly protein SufD [Acidimicrobiales bacterium]|nr:Fe-S cluster assembly protein SufD [Acidimicrobiales bacterium]